MAQAMQRAEGFRQSRFSLYAFQKEHDIPARLAIIAAGKDIRATCLWHRRKNGSGLLIHGDSLGFPLFGHFSA